MRYVKITEYQVMRSHECEDASFRVRLKLMNIYVSRDKTMLKFINLLEWHRQGYYDDTMIRQLAAEGIITQAECTKIVGDSYAV